MARLRFCWLLATGLLLTVSRTTSSAAQAPVSSPEEPPAPEAGPPAREEAPSPPDASSSPASPQELGYGPRVGEEPRTSAPGDESGVVVRDEPARRSLLVVPRALLALPEAALRLGTEPIRLLMLLEDRYHVAARLRRFFFNDAGTFGIFPTFFFETGFGANVGLRLVHRDLFGRGEGLTMRIGFGGLERQVYALRLHTGDRLERARLAFHGGYLVSNRSRFYTIGNVDEIDVEDAVAPIDARDADVAVKTRYLERSLFAAVRSELRLGPRFMVSLGERLRHRSFGVGDPRETFPWITQVYAAQSIVGFEDQSDAYTSAHMRYANTRSDRPLVTEALPTRGFRFDAWGGYQQGLGNPFRFGRLGFDAQGFVPLFSRDRVLRVRVRSTTVVGEDARIPFVDLPTLGGRLLLRGYARDRFRDRSATVATAEYQFPVLYRAGAYVFLDAGRVYHDLSDIADGPVRLGFGGGLVGFKREHMLLAVQVASSIDGGVYVHLNFSPTDGLGDLE